ETEVELPKLHQRSILDRIKLDNQIQEQIAVIQKLVLLALTISSLNLIRGGYDFYQTYVNPNNDWGPTKTNILRDHERVENKK
ncbi:MAG: hypothetical protein RLZZ184_1613, partial [Cyanobacteriota bacterium]